MDQEKKISAMTTAILVGANLVLAAILGLAAWFIEWSGIAFGAGFLAGAFFVFVWARLELGHWI